MLVFRVAACFVALSAASVSAFADGDGSGSDTTATPTEPTNPVPTQREPPPAGEHKITPSPDDLPAFDWQPFGYLRMQYIAVQNDPNIQFVGRDDGFEIQNARVGARGHLGPIVSFVISIDGAVDERSQINTPQGKLAVGLRDAYADVKLAGGLIAHAGFFQTWVDPEAQVADTARAFVDLPIESRGIRATEGFQTPSLPPGRSEGVAIRLEPKPSTGAPTFGFEVAAQNGADEFSSNNDNDALAASVAVLVRLPHDSWIVAAGRYNPRTVGDLPFRQDETDVQGSVGGRIAAGPIALAGGAFVQRTTFDTTGGPTQNAFGAHAQALVALPTSLPLAVGYRFGIIDPSSLILTDRVIEHTVGAVLGVPRYRMRLQLQLVHVVEQDARELSNDRLQVAAELAL